MTNPLRRLVERLATAPEDVAQPALDEVRALVADRQYAQAQSLATSLGSSVTGRLAGGIIAFPRGFLDLAWECLHGLPAAVWAAEAPAEYVRTGLVLAPDATLREIRQLVADDPDGVGARSWYELLTALFGFGAQADARAVFAIFERHVRSDPAAWPAGERHADWLRPWVAADAGSPSAPRSASGRRTIAIMDYGHPGADRASANLGDHVQSIAALGHLVRHTGVRLHGREDLTALLAELRERTRPELRRSDIESDVDVITVHRDASMYEPIPPDTWVLCFGWYMHALFGMRHGFPLHDELRPIFVSFHCNKRALLTPEAIAYLRRYGPVGCRDWTTVHLLLSCGVPAFFSGCVTTTISTVFPELEPGAGPAADAPPAYVDMPPEEVPEGASTYAHSDPEVRRRSFTANAGLALERLGRYRREHSGVVTSRLHCYLPMRSIGAPVDFRPRNRSDIRFDGLIDLDDDAFDAMRAELLDRLEPVHTAILGGRPEEEVYAAWREVTADAVTVAAERHHAPVPTPAPAHEADADAAVRDAAATTVRHGEPAPGAVHVAVVLPKRSGMALSVLAASLLEHASGPVRLSVLALDGSGGVRRRLAERLPQLAFDWIPIGDVDAGVARLLLPELLPDADRVVVPALPAVAVAAADVAELAGLDLGGHALAAPTRPDRTRTSGFGLIHAAAGRLRDQTEAASALRRSAHARHHFDFDAFSTDVLVLDLERLRRDGTGRQALGLMDAYGLDDLEALHVLIGPGRATVPARWATVPTRMPVRDPALLHWADRVKPWHEALTPERDEWRRYAARFTTPPAG